MSMWVSIYLSTKFNGACTWYGLADTFTQVGINLGDPVFRGNYRDKQVHEDDLQDVINRALDAGCQKFMVTGSDLEESRHAVQLARDHRMSSDARERVLCFQDY